MIIILEAGLMLVSAPYYLVRYTDRKSIRF